MFHPKEDGITHINIYSGGETELGRGLSNFAHTPFECPDGHFESVEGYWHWLHAEGSPEREELRTLYGAEALNRGRKIRAGRYMEDQAVFKGKIVKAIQCKLDAHPALRQLLAESTLPFAHYYVMGGKVKDAGHEWQIPVMGRLRLMVQKTR